MLSDEDLWTWHQRCVIHVIQLDRASSRKKGHTTHKCLSCARGFKATHGVGTGTVYTNLQTHLRRCAPNEFKKFNDERAEDGDTTTVISDYMSSKTASPEDAFD